MSYLLAIDQGTSSTRAMLYSAQGQLVKKSQYPITQYYPDAGWVEQDAEEIWQKTLKAIENVVARVDIKQIAACGMTNQRETTVLWNKQTGQCLYPAIVWQDRRTEAFCQSLAEHQTDIQQKTGLFLDSYFSATKICWLLNHIPDAKQCAAEGKLAFGTIDSFLIWRLTGGRQHATDVTNASRTLLFNIHEHRWDASLLKLFEIPETILPQVKDCDAWFGEIDKSLLGCSIPITGVVGDQQAALIGQCCFSEGTMKATYGTGGFLLMNSGEKIIHSQSKLLSTIAYRLQNKTAYGLEGSIYQAGTTVKWLREQLKLFTHDSETEKLAESLASNDEVYFIPSFTGLGAPHWLSHKGAVITGLSPTSNQAHFARAALESVAYQTRDILTCIRKDYPKPLSLIRADGGMSANAWFLQFLASQCNLLIERPKDIEITAKGAAMTAGLGIGLYDSYECLGKIWHSDACFYPTRDKAMDDDYDGWKNALQLLQTH